MTHPAIAPRDYSAAEAQAASTVNAPVPALASGALQRPGECPVASAHVILLLVMPSVIFEADECWP
jgi:hypothetical protein